MVGSRILMKNDKVDYIEKTKIYRRRENKFYISV